LRTRAKFIANRRKRQCFLKQLSNEIQEILLSSSEKAFQKPELTFSKIEINLIGRASLKKFSTCGKLFDKHCKRFKYGF
jgi:hypothetical protein